MRAEIIRGLSFDDYHELEAASNSRLGLIKRSPAHLYAERLDPSPDTPALITGRAFHSLVLEPDTFAGIYDMAGQCCGTTGKGTRCTNAGNRRRAGEWYCGVRGHDPEPDMQPDRLTVLDPEQAAAVQGMRDAVMSHELAGPLIERATYRELSALWTDERTGQLCKARWDAPDADAGVIADLKSCDDASPSGFRRSLGRWAYHRQNAFYMDGAAAVAPGSFDTFVFIAVEKRPPYGVAMYRLPASAVQAGRDEYEPLLQRYAECVRDNHWPSYPAEVLDLDIPAYAYWNIYD
jgi:exodeoxyribonuclease VIII